MMPSPIAPPQRIELPFCLRLDADQRNLVDQVRRYSRERLEPLLGETTTHQQRQEAVGLSAQLGFGAAMLPEEDGGLDIDALNLCLLLEEVATGPLAVAAEITLSVPALAIAREMGAIEQVFPDGVDALFGGHSAVSVAIPGPDERSAFVLARPQADDPLLTLTSAPEGEPHGLLCLPPQRVHKLLSEGRELASWPGLRLVRVQIDEQKDGRYRHAWASPDERRRCLTWYGLWLCALLVGSLRSCVASAFGYARERVTFQKPIIHHQAVSMRLADMAIAAEGAKLMMWDAAARFSSAGGLSAGRMAKLARHLAATSLEVHRSAVQVYGGHGYVEGHPPARRFQEAAIVALLLPHLARACELDNRYRQ